jgi:hypothetical protein
LPEGKSYELLYFWSSTAAPGDLDYKEAKNRLKETLDTCCLRKPFITEKQLRCLSAVNFANEVPAALFI